MKDSMSCVSKALIGEIGVLKKRTDDHHTFKRIDNCYGRWSSVNFD